MALGGYWVITVGGQGGYKWFLEATSGYEHVTGGYEWLWVVLGGYGVKMND